MKYRLRSVPEQPNDEAYQRDDEYNQQSLAHWGKPGRNLGIDAQSVTLLEQFFF